MSNVNQVIAYLKEQVSRLESQIAEAEELIRLAKAMGLDVAQQELELNRLKQQYSQMKTGLENYLRGRQLAGKQ